MLFVPFVAVFIGVISVIYRHHTDIGFLPSGMIKRVNRPISATSGLKRENFSTFSRKLGLGMVLEDLPKAISVNRISSTKQPSWAIETVSSKEIKETETGVSSIYEYETSNTFSDEGVESQSPVEKLRTVITKSNYGNVVSRVYFVLLFFLAVYIHSRRVFLERTLFPIPTDLGQQDNGLNPEGSKTSQPDYYTRNEIDALFENVKSERLAASSSPKQDPKDSCQAVLFSEIGGKKAFKREIKNDLRSELKQQWKTELKSAIGQEVKKEFAEDLRKVLQIDIDERLDTFRKNELEKLSIVSLGNQNIEGDSGIGLSQNAYTQPHWKAWEIGSDGWDSPRNELKSPAFTKCYVEDFFGASPVTGTEKSKLWIERDLDNEEVSNPEEVLYFMSEFHKSCLPHGDRIEIPSGLRKGLEKKGIMSTG